MCRSKQQVTASAVEGPFLSFALTGSTSECIRPSLITTVVDHIPVYTLVDSGSSASYISFAFCLRLGRSPEGLPSKTTMASSSLSAKVNGSTRANLMVSGQRYSKFSFRVMDNLWANVILGVDFMKLHWSVTFETAGTRAEPSPGSLHLRGFTFVWGGGLYVYAGEAWCWHFTKTPIVYSVIYFDLGGLVLCLGRLSPPKPPVTTGLVQGFYLFTH